MGDLILSIVSEYLLKMSFTTAEEFVSRNDLKTDDVDVLTREQLYAIAHVLGLKVFSGAKKGFLIRLCVKGLKENGLLDEGESDSEAVESTGIEALALQLKIKETEKEMREKEIELRKREMEHEAEMKRIEWENRLSPPTPNNGESSQPDFDFSKNIRLVSRFDEKDVAQYFSSFESLSLKLKWPKEHWPTLLHSVFEGKARDVYTALTLEQSCQYDLDKETILKSYELVPEAYRQKFRNMKRKNADQTYVEFVREKANHFDRWLQAMNVNGDYVKLKELMLLEELKECVPNEIKTYLSDRNVTKLEKAAALADDYVLSHKFVFETTRSSHKSGKPWNRKGHHEGKPKPDPNSSPLGKSDDSVSQTKGKSYKKDRPVCSFCHKEGHTYENCFKRKNQEKAVALIDRCKVPCATESPVSLTGFNPDQGQLEGKVSSC